MPRVPPMPRGERARELSPAQPTTCAATTLLARAFRPRSCACRSCIPRLPRWRTRFWFRCSTRAQPDRSLYRARRMRRLPCPSATSLACAMAGFSATTCCAIFRPFKRVGVLAAQRRSTPCAPPSTASRCARCPSNAWRRALPGFCSRCWSTCSPNRPSSTCSIIACSTWC